MLKLIPRAVVLGALALAASGTFALAAEPMTKDGSAAMGDTTSMQGAPPKSDTGNGAAMMNDDKMGGDGIKADEGMQKDDAMKPAEPGK